MGKNEAELEARISSILLNIFPTFQEAKVQHQKSYSFKFGRHDVSVDLKKPSKYSNRAILDILLSVDDINVILLELKKEDLMLTDEDVNQGISYSRLLHPIPPITLISNGRDNIFYNSYTKERLSIDTLDLNYIQSLINNNFALALNDFKDAINVLLNKDNELFSKVINNISERKFSRLFGSIGQYEKTICPEFIIQREIVGEIISEFDAGHSLLGLIAPAFGGKTCILYDFFERIKSQTSHLLYIDCNDHNYSILQELANNFSQASSIVINKDKIREWLLNALTDSSFYLLIDNFSIDIPETIKSEIIELIDMFRNNSNRILYTIDEFNFNKASKVDGRQYSSIIGEESHVLELYELNDQEYQQANNLLFEKFKVQIEHGGHFTPIYRQPRNLRVIADLYREPDGGQILPQGQFIKVISVPDVEHLVRITRKEVYGDSINSLYKKIAKCFVQEYELRKSNPNFALLASGTGIFSVDTFKISFPDHYDAMIKSGAVTIREISEELFVVIPKMPELVARHSIEIIRNEIKNFSEQEHDYKKVAERLIELTTNLPYNDIVGAGVISQLGTEGDIDLFSQLIQELLKLPPKIEQISDGTKVLMYIEGKGLMPFELNYGDNGSFISDFLPFPILSQLAGYPLKLENPGPYNQFAFHNTMLKILGSFQHYIFRPDSANLENMRSVTSHDLPDGGTVVCEKEGIIEPIVQSLQKCFFEIPDEFNVLCEDAKKQKNIYLLWRIYLALLPIRFIANHDISLRATLFLDSFISEFSDSLPIHST